MEMPKSQQPTSHPDRIQQCPSLCQLPQFLPKLFDSKVHLSKVLQGEEWINQIMEDNY